MMREDSAENQWPAVPGTGRASARIRGTRSGCLRNPKRSWCGLWLECSKLGDNSIDAGRELGRQEFRIRLSIAGVQGEIKERPRYSL